MPGSLARPLASHFEVLAGADLVGHLDGEDDDGFDAIAAVTQGLKREIKSALVPLATSAEGTPIACSVTERESPEAATRSSRPTSSAVAPSSASTGRRLAALEGAADIITFANSHT